MANHGNIPQVWKEYIFTEGAKLTPVQIKDGRYVWAVLEFRGDHHYDDGINKTNDGIDAPPLSGESIEELIHPFCVPKPYMQFTTKQVLNRLSIEGDLDVSMTKDNMKYPMDFLTANYKDGTFNDGVDDLTREQFLKKYEGAIWQIH